MNITLPAEPRRSKAIRITVTAAILLIAAAILPAGDIRCEHFFLGMPRGSGDDNVLIIRDLYALSNNPDTRFADWVVYRLTPEEAYGNLDLERKWRTDPWLDVEETLKATPSSADEYSGANAAFSYERGHLAPLASFKGSEDASSVNYYSNIAPQVHDLNNGPWKYLEIAIRNEVLQGEEVHVMTGPYYSKGEPMPALPRARPGHRVPSGYWKIVCFGDEMSPDVSAFLFSQSNLPWTDFRSYIVSVDMIEERTGLDFFSDLDDAREIRLEQAAEVSEKLR